MEVVLQVNPPLVARRGDSISSSRYSYSTYSTYLHSDPETKRAAILQSSALNGVLPCDPFLCFEDGSPQQKAAFALPGTYRYLSAALIGQGAAVPRSGHNPCGTPTSINIYLLSTQFGFTV